MKSMLPMLDMGLLLILLINYLCLLYLWHLLWAVVIDLIKKVLFSFDCLAYFKNKSCIQICLPVI